MNDIILVDEHDNPVGEGEKMSVHEEGLLHRAFSVFVFRVHNNDKEVLIQQRHQDKYHCGGLWTNTCCSHPAPGEETIAAGERRLREEFGFSVPLLEVGVFTYKAPFDNGLTEHEIDHVLVGEWTDEVIDLDEKEISDYRWVAVDTLWGELEAYPERFTPWFSKAFSVSNSRFN